MWLLGPEPEFRKRAACAPTPEAALQTSALGSDVQETGDDGR